MKAVIMAGGRGTRVASVCATLPKPMLPLGGKPILERQITVLRREGFTDIVLVVGHLGSVIKDYFGDGSAFGVTISYVEETEPLGTAGALALLKDTLAGDDFLLLCGDLLFDVDLARFLAHHREKKGLATILTHPSNHPRDSVLVATDKAGRVTAFLPPDSERPSHRNATNAGLHFFSPKILERFAEVKKTDLDREVLRPLAARGELYAYRSPEYVRDMGTPERLLEGERAIAEGRVEKSNLKTLQRAVFLDRDGTINRHIGFLTNPTELILLDGAAKAICRLHEAGFLVIVATNQPVLARGEVTEEGLLAIHARLEELLGEQGAILDDIFYCPHHPDKGFAGEVKALKIPCNCRKPAPGLLLAAAKKYNVDLTRSYMIGDGAADVLAGRAAGCRTAVLGTHPDADFCGNSLLDCVEQILKAEDTK